MAEMRGRSYSPSPPPARGYGRRGRSPSPRGRYSGRPRDLPTSLLVRNLRHDCRYIPFFLSSSHYYYYYLLFVFIYVSNCFLSCRPEDLRRPFGQFGALKDIYLPKDYYTGLASFFSFLLLHLFFTIWFEYHLFSDLMLLSM